MHGLAHVLQPIRCTDSCDEPNITLSIGMIDGKRDGCFDPDGFRALLEELAGNRRDDSRGNSSRLDGVTRCSERL